MQKRVMVSKIISWCIAHFGGKKGIRKTVKEEPQKEVAGYSVIFKKNI